MRNRRTLTFLAAFAAAALVATTALAGDPSPSSYKKCAGCGFSVDTDGPQPCDNGASTCITYTVSGGVPDHLGIFLRSEATLIDSSQPVNISSACGKGDNVLGLGSYLLCHERLLRFDNRAAKSVEFRLKVAGRREAIITTVTLRKGTTQCAFPIAGIGLEPPTPPAACVNSCGNFDPHQSVLKTEIYRFESCMMEFHRSADGSVAEDGGFLTYPAPDAPQGTVCTPQEGPISDIVVSHVLDNQGAFGDGWLNTGSNSCSTRMIGGRYYTTCW
jgi:hypothetical protein